MLTLLALNPPTRAKSKTKSKKTKSKGKKKMARRRRRRNPRKGKKLSKKHLAALRAGRARYLAGKGKKKSSAKRRRSKSRSVAVAAAPAKKARRGRGRRKLSSAHIAKMQAGRKKYLAGRPKRSSGSKRRWKPKKRYVMVAKVGHKLSALQKSRLAMIGAATNHNGKYTLNPRRRRRNPVRRRRNPLSVSGTVGTVKGTIKSVFSVRTLKVGASAGAGMVVARLAPAIIARIPVVGGLTNMLGRFRDPILGAIAVVVGSRLARKVSVVEPTAFIAGGLGVAVIDGAKAVGLGRFIPGSASSGVSGLSDIITPSQLVNQEAIYGGMGDYLTLAGGVPEQYFAGGLNDYVDFTSPAAGVAAQAASFAQTSWTPGAEGFTAGGN